MLFYLFSIKLSLLPTNLIHRHSTFTVVTSKTYNPFLNMEHSINREQGFVFYLPINNELRFDMVKSSLWFSFYRPNNMISGISLKSRTRTITQGKPLHTNEPYSEIVVYEGDPNLMVFTCCLQLQMAFFLILSLFLILYGKWFQLFAFARNSCIL